MNTIIIIIVVQILINVILIIWFRHKINSFLGSGTEIDKIRREVAALVMELNSSADRNISILEDRIENLKELMAQADKRIAGLNRELSNRKKELAIYDNLGRVSQATKTIEQKTEVTEVNASPSIPFLKFSEKPLPIEEAFVDKVLSLSRRGFSSDIIAARLDATMAEVDLVISLEQERNRTHD